MNGRLATMGRGALILLGILLGLATRPPSTNAAFPGSNGRIVFSSNRPDFFSSKIFSINPDGTDERLLAENADEQPKWSPDGSKIAFSQQVGGNWDIWVMNADGGQPIRLTTDSATDTEPTWSPDGQKIAFVSERSGTLQDIWVMNANGTGQTRLTQGTGREENPDWSPDGMKIAFQSLQDVPQGYANWEIYVMNANGTSMANLINDDPLTNPPDDQSPSWCPNASAIAFARGSHGIFTIDPNGGGMTQLTSNTELVPAWSPDGLKIVYSHFDAFNFDYNLYVLDLASGARTQITTNEWTDSWPDWQPLGAVGGIAGPPSIAPLSHPGTRSSIRATLALSALIVALVVVAGIQLARQRRC